MEASKVSPDPPVRILLSPAPPGQLAMVAQFPARQAPPGQLAMVAQFPARQAQLAVNLLSPAPQVLLVPPAHAGRIAPLRVRLAPLGLQVVTLLSPAQLVQLGLQVVTLLSPAPQVLQVKQVRQAQLVVTLLSPVLLALLVLPVETPQSQAPQVLQAQLAVTPQSPVLLAQLVLPVETPQSQAQLARQAQLAVTLLSPAPPDPQVTGVYRGFRSHSKARLPLWAICLLLEIPSTTRTLSPLTATCTFGMEPRGTTSGRSLVHRARPAQSDQQVLTLRL